jgi:hypothetical protein
MNRACAIAVSLALVSNAGASEQPCKVNWKDVHATAMQRGMAFAFRVHRGLGECFIHKAAFVVSAATGSDLTCELRMFSGMSLSTGWKVSLLSDSGLPFAAAPAGAEQANLTWLVSTAAPGTTVTFVPKRLEFNAEATSCTDWLAALAGP